MTATAYLLQYVSSPITRSTVSAGDKSGRSILDWGIVRGVRIGTRRRCDKYYSIPK